MWDSKLHCQRSAYRLDVDSAHNTCDFCGTNLRSTFYEHDGDIYCKDCLLKSTRLKEVPVGAVCEDCECELEGGEAYKLGDFIFCEECVLDFTICCS